MKTKLLEGDCLEKLKLIPDNYVDSIVTDPPAGISFMNKEWDDDKGGRDHWIKWLSEVMIEAKRTLKAGGHCFIWALPRTSHWTATALEDAGFEIRDIVTHVFGSGFPKSHNISKAIDKKFGLEGEVVGKKRSGMGHLGPFGSAPEEDKHIDIIKPASEEAKQFEGWGTALKPASEHWILCRKPLSEKTIADNVLKWGTGGINIDKSRIGEYNENRKNHINTENETSFLASPQRIYTNAEGRFPSNFLHDGSDEVMKEFDKAGKSKSNNKNDGKTYDNYKLDGHQSFLNKQSGKHFTDEGSPARFFYCSKPSSKEKNEGLEENNNHPTIKSTKLMSYLINMITPPNGIVLDPFMGSGTTGVSAVQNNFNFIGIEQNKDYLEIAKARIKYHNERNSILQ